MLLLLLSLILVHEFGMSGAWYVLVVLLWFLDMVVRLVVMSSVCRHGLERAVSMVPGVRGVVGGEGGEGR